MIYEIGRDMEKFYYDKDSLLIKIWASENQKMPNDVNLKQETMNMFNELTNQQFEKNEVLYMNHLKAKALNSVDRFKQFMLEFHSQDKNVKENKKMF